MLIRKFLLLSVVLFLATAVIAQKIEKPVPDDNNISTADQAQHQKWLDHEEAFPAKERGMWQVGANFGMLRVSGDVDSEWGYGWGVSVRKSLGYMFSLRLSYTQGEAFGMNSRNAGSSLANNAGMNGANNPGVDYWNENTQRGLAYVNYNMHMRQLSLEALINLTTFSFHQREKSIGIYALAGANFFTYLTKIDQLDKNGNRYDYETVRLQSNDNPEKTEQLLKDLWNGAYESQAEVDAAQPLLWDKWRWEPTASVGIGMAFRLSKRLEVGLEHRAHFLDDDLLDGVRWSGVLTSDGRNAPTKANDTYHYTNMFLNFNIGKGEDPDWWVNPLEYTYDYLAYLDQQLDLADDDNDGVPNKWDEEPDTPEGAVVDTKGRTMDSDGDGCPDHEDPEPFSSPEFPIVDCVTQWPEGITEERVIELIKENTTKGWFLPTIHFDVDKSNIKPQYYTDLKNVADVMNTNKDLQVNVVGHADWRHTEEYNMALSQRRSESAVNFLVDNYGIDRDRFNIQYKGETDPLIENARTEAELLMNRRVEFNVVND